MTQRVNNPRNAVGVDSLNATPETTQALRAQAETADCLAEQLQMMEGIITEWRTQLPDRLSSAGWSTREITEAIELINGTGPNTVTDLYSVQDGLSALHTACENASLVGAEAREKVATGEVEPFLAQ